MNTARQQVHVDARPEPLAIDLNRTVVVVVDMQNDFGTEGGMFHRAGIDITLIQAVIEPTARVLRAARNAGLPVIYLKMQHRPDLSDAGTFDSPHRRKHAHFGLGDTVQGAAGQEGRILIQDTWSTDIVSGLTPEPGDIIVSKHRYSGFFQTDLEMILRSLGATALVVTGCTTSVCVEATIRDAMYRDFTCLLLEDCTAEPIGSVLARSNHEASLLTIQLLLGWTATSEAFITALGLQEASVVAQPLKDLTR